MTMATAPRVAGTIRSKNPLKGAVEILPERLYYAALKTPPPSHNILASVPKRTKKQASDAPTPTSAKKQIHFFNMDNELVYWNFFLDFGPLNLGQVTRFCAKLQDKLRKFPVVCYYSSTQSDKRANAIFCICVYQMLYLDRTPEQAFCGFDYRNLRPVCEQQLRQSGKPQPPSSSAANGDTDVRVTYYSKPPVSTSQGMVTIAELPPFHDASPCACTYDLNILDCLRGMVKAMSFDFYNPETFDVDEYEHFEQVENGDLNWIVKDKILAFAGPSFERHISPEGYCTLAPSDYIPYFQRKNVELVVRLNKRCYNEQDFINAGINHVDAFFLDGSCPPTKILLKVLEAFENCTGAFAVHCKAGLGRTGTCIGAYLMKHYRFTAAEAIGWMRVCRPGCVIGPQQHYLQQIEARMWHEGEREGRIEPPIHAVSTEEDEQEDEIMEVADQEAIEGRAGQADGLLAARGRRGHDHPHVVTPVTASAADSSPVPMTPEQSSKFSNVVPAVTPEASQLKTHQLW